MNSILFVAPFGELAGLAEKVIKKMGLSIQVIVASNESAVTAVKSYPEKTILISRGGTAYDLRKLPERTVVEVSASFSDILPTLEEAIFSGYKKIGIVTNDNIIDNIVKDFSFDSVSVWHRPCKNHAEIRNMIAKLHDEGVQYIIGCHQAVKKAQELHLANAYINSGKVSIVKAINEALKIEQTKKMAQFQMERVNAVINNIQEGIIIFEQNHEPVFFNTLANNVFNEESKDDWYERILNQSPKFGESKLITIGNNKVLMKGIPLDINDNKNDVFIFQEVSNIEKQEREVRLSTYHKGFYAKAHFSDIFTASLKMRSILERAGKFAKTDSNVLIYGDTGTGKEGIAQSIHNASRRAAQPFVSVNCASLPPGLVESELFGYVDGAFTGARRSGKPGLFEMAHQGTIFLDEIGELSLDIQGRLLRVLQEKEVMRIGDDKIIPLDIRVICATNKNLHTLTKEGKFRYDLYYRINVLRIKLPSLKDRREDILPLLEFYLQRFSHHAKRIHITPAAREKFLQYQWPGNIRELKNVAEVLAFDNADITPRQLDDLLENDEIQGTAVMDSDNNTITFSADMSFKDMEKEILAQLMEKHTPEEVCAKLGISRVTLWRKINGVQKRKI